MAHPRIPLLVALLAACHPADTDTSRTEDTGDTDPADTDTGPAPTCDDGVQNGDELGVDCGGSCDFCGECAEDTDCQPHAACDTSEVDGVCACAPSYTLDGERCVWSSPIQDPGFETGTPWELTGTATIDTTALGPANPGWALINPPTAGLSSVRQTLAQPDLDLGEPLILIARMGLAANEATLATYALGIGNAWHTGTLSTGWYTREHCLGEAGYGGEVQVTAMSWPGSYMGGPLKFDHIDLRLDSEGVCPAVGEIFDADFEGGDGWTGSGFSIAEAAGEGGSSAAIGTVQAVCGSATYTSKASIPGASMAGPALELWWAGSADYPLDIGLGVQTPLATLFGTGIEAPTRTRICVPPPLRGASGPLSLTVPQERDSTCVGSEPREVVVDDLSLVDEPTCAGSPYLVDGGFELSDGVVGPWTFMGHMDGSHARKVVDDTLAHTGDGVLEFMANSKCNGNTSASTLGIVPEPTNTEGPALVLWYRTAAENEDMRLHVQGEIVPNAVEWTRHVVCVDPVRAGGPFPLNLNFWAQTGGTCDVAFGPDYAWVDDVALTTDPSCPRE